MSDDRTRMEPWAAALDRRAALLARLIESHPALHLLAEYEAIFLDRHPCVDRLAGSETTTANDLLARMDASIVALGGPATDTRRTAEASCGYVGASQSCRD